MLIGLKKDFKLLSMGIRGRWLTILGSLTLSFCVYGASARIVDEASSAHQSGVDNPDEPDNVFKERSPPGEPLPDVPHDHPHFPTQGIVPDEPWPPEPRAMQNLGDRMLYPQPQQNPHNPKAHDPHQHWGH